MDLTDTAAVRAAADDADLLWLETPSNPLLEVADLPALCAAGRQAGAIVGVDNTFATPLLQQPLALGADVVVHSATKFIGGHSDLLSGIAIARDQALAGRLRHRRGMTGATPGALEAFLALRGLRTLALRLDRGQHNAGELARRLDQHPAVSRVRYPGLPGDPGHRTAAAQMTGFGAVLAFEVAEPPPLTGSVTPCTSSSTPPAWVASRAPSSGAASSPDKNTYPPASCASASAANTSTTSGTT